MPWLFLRQAEVSYLQMAIVVDYDVLRFDISVYNLLVVQVSETDENLDKAVACFILSHTFNLA